MPKFGREMVVHPISTEKVSAEMKLRMYGDVKYKVEQVSESIHVMGKQQPLEECIKAIRQLESKGSEYAVIEMFTDDKGITRLNVCHMKATEK